ncbi:nose resistant to fluoxetine protein 6-like [Oppia nitens]|uniref:nose resistant to fluoxetine protein 6-like n=1 Tax=Oppia nitens TaxID=1686743 RepID=UPI0023DA7847|nr:nose resistant to fluoxetine protein 6-like [Oppia nitens]
MSSPIKSYELCFYMIVAILLSHSLLFDNYSVKCQETSTTTTAVDDYEDNNDSDNDSDNNTTHESSDRFVDLITDEVIDFVAQKPPNETDDNVLLVWHQLINDLSDRLWDKILPFVAKSQHQITNISQDCTGSLFKTILSFKKQELWAVKFMDSMGKLPSGFLEGTVTSFGNVDECLDIDVPDDGYDEAFHGKYCWLYLRPELPRKPDIVRHNQQIFNLSGTPAEGTVFEHISEVFSGIYSVGAIRQGICIPSNCRRDDITPFLVQFTKPYKLRPQLSIKCMSKHELTELNTHQIVSISLLTVMTFLLIIGSLSYICLNDGKRKLYTKLVQCWSVQQNYKQLTASPSKSSRHMSAIHGIRVLTIVWTTINHNYTFGGFYKIQWIYNSLIQVRKIPESLLFQLVFNAWALVETFFFISGLLAIYIMLPMLEKRRGKVNIIVLVLHRLIRVIPSICGIMAINFLWPIVTTGPILIDDSTDVYLSQSCRNNWWHNILLINNWFAPDDICLINTWYLSADFQLFLCAILIIYAFYWNVRLGLILNGVVLVISIMGSAFTTYYYHLYPTLLNVHTINLDYVEHHLRYGYFWTFHHLGPYCCGIFIGYFLLNTPNNHQLPKSKMIIPWIVSPFICLSVIFCAYYWNQGVEPSRLSSILYSSLSRTIWCMGLSWITYICCIGSGGIVNKILSHPWFIPLSRLSFGVYLSHMVVIFIIFFTKKSTTDWTHFYFITTGMITIILSHILAAILYFLFEAPFANLEKLIFYGHHSHKKDADDNDHRVVNQLDINMFNNKNHNNNFTIGYNQRNLVPVLKITKM